MSPPLDSRIAALLAELRPDDRDLDFSLLLEAIHTSRWTGPVTFDFLNGVPRQINLGQPVKLVICSGSLDKSNGV